MTKVHIVTTAATKVRTMAMENIYHLMIVHHQQVQDIPIITLIIIIVMLVILIILKIIVEVVIHKVIIVIEAVQGVAVKVIEYIH